MIKIITIVIKFIVTTLIALLFSSCNHSFRFDNGIKGSGNTTSEKRTVNEDFKSIVVSDGISVTVEQSDFKSIIVEAEDNLLEHISTKIENGVLIIESDTNVTSIGTLKVFVKMPEINGLTASSGAQIESANVLITEKIDVESSSGSQIDIDVEADAISLETDSGSTIEARGKALQLKTVSSSGSLIDAEKLMTNEVESEASSGSSTDVYPIVKLNAKASSGSTIGYHKIPTQTIIKTTKFGGSIVEK